MSKRFDAIVVGAGPAGASAAILLARAGWHVALVEKMPFPRRKVCGECIAASNLPLLDALGIGAAFATRAGAPLRRVALMAGTRTVVAGLPPGDEGRPAWGRALGREVLDTLLVAEAARAGATVFQPAALRSIEGRPGEFRCSIRELDGSELPGSAQSAGQLETAGSSGVARSVGSSASRASREIEAPLVIAAHGSWEPLPFERAEARRQRRPGSLLAFKANFRNARLAADLLPVLAFDGGYGGMVVADDGLATLACCVRSSRLERWRDVVPGRRAGDAVERLLVAEIEGVAQALDGATREGPWLATGPIRPGVRLGRDAGRQGDGVFRIGNAAGEAHPIVGEGISMALQSAALLAARLAPLRAAIVDPARSGRLQAALLSEHAATWRRHFGRRLRLAAFFASVAMRPAATNLAWPLLQVWPTLLTCGARLSGKTHSAIGADELVRA